MTRTGFGRRVWTSALGGAIALAASGWAFAQTSSPEQFSAHDADGAWTQLRSEVPGLKASWNFETGFPSFIFGRPIRIFGVPQTDADYESAARSLVDTYPGLFGFTSSALVTEQVKHLALSSIGTTDKVAVGFSQWASGVEVVGGSVSVLFNFDGAIVGIENNGLPNVETLDVVPAISDAQATLIAINAFRRSSQVLSVDLGVVESVDGTRPALAWIIELFGGFDASKGLPAQEKFQVDARNGAVIRRLNSIHTFTDMTGLTAQWATPGVLPDSSSNPVFKFTYNRGRVTSPVGSSNTDMTGNWTITYTGSTVQTVTWNFDINSLYAYVDDQGGADFTKSKSVTPGNKDFTGLNQVPSEYNTAEMNAQRNGVKIREWIVTLDPTETKADFRQRLNVNINSSCNAYYNGSSTNYYRNQGGCVNTCYTTVVHHENGHWMNDKYASGNGSDGFGEGAADSWAMYIEDTPIVGEDFFTSGGDIRTGLNTRQYCGTCASGCHGGVHANGEVLMGALWKVRDYLNITHGDASGDAIADSLFLRWFQGYNAKTICDTNETQLLTLDDDNGNIDDGTPNSNDIEQGFEDQGYPGYY